MAVYKFGDVVPRHLLEGIERLPDKARPHAKQGMTYVYVGENTENFKYGEIIKLDENYGLDRTSYFMHIDEEGDEVFWRDLARKSSVPNEAPEKTVSGVGGRIANPVTEKKKSSLDIHIVLKPTKPMVIRDLM